MGRGWRILARVSRLGTSLLGTSKRGCPCSVGVLWNTEAKKSLHTSPKMPPCDFTPEKYESYPYAHILEVQKENLSPMATTFYQKPLLLNQGHMQWLFDFEGRRYLDFFAGIVTVSVGHCHPKVMAAAKKQLGRLWHTSSVYLHPAIHEYAEKLTAHLPGSLKVIFLVNSGSEANDLAMVMARVYSGNFDIISFRGAYHGCTPYSVGLTNIGQYKPTIANGFGCQSHFTKLRESLVQPLVSSQARDRYIEQFQETLKACLPRKIAGFIAEPIQGVNGAVQYPKGFLKSAFQMVREQGGICIADEVQTGFGRMGSHFWGFQTHDVLPDIITMAKGIGNGFPMGAVVTTTEIANSLAKSQLHFNTFGGNPMACTIGSAVLDAIREDGLQKNSEEVGTYLLLELAKLRDKFEIVGDVRGKGLMVGVEMVTDQESRQPLPAKEMNAIHDDCKNMGLLIGKGGLYGQTFRVKPPMCVTKQDVDFAVEVFHVALSRHMERRASSR